MDDPVFKEKARQHVFNCHLKAFPVVFEMYARSFDLKIDRDEAMSQIMTLIRTSKNVEVAYTLVCHYLDSLEE